MTNELTINELDAVTGGDMTSQVGRVVSTRKAQKSEPTSTDTGGNAFWMGFIIGLIV